jgi:hypothetical protein
MTTTSRSRDDAQVPAVQLAKAGNRAEELLVRRRHALTVRTTRFGIIWFDGFRHLLRRIAPTLVGCATGTVRSLRSCAEMRPTPAIRWLVPLCAHCRSPPRSRWRWRGSGLPLRAGPSPRLATAFRGWPRPGFLPGGPPPPLATALVCTTNQGAALFQLIALVAVTVILGSTCGVAVCGIGCRDGWGRAGREVRRLHALDPRYLTVHWGLAC